MLSNLSSFQLKLINHCRTLSTNFLAPPLTTFFLITFLFFCENPDTCPVPIIAIRMEAFSISLSVTTITWLTAIRPIWPFCPWRTNRKWARLDICPYGMIVFADVRFEKIFLNSFPSMKFLMNHWIRTTMLNSSNEIYEILQVFSYTHLYVFGMFLAFFSIQVIEHCDQLLHSAHEWQSGLWQMASCRLSPLHVLFGHILCLNFTPPIPHDFEHLDHSVHSVQVSNSDVAKVTFLTRCAPMNSFG